MIKVLVESDFTSPLEKEIWINTKSIGYSHKLEFDYIPPENSSCQIFSQNNSECFMDHPKLQNFIKHDSGDILVDKKHFFQCNDGSSNCFWYGLLKKKLNQHFILVEN